MTLYEALEDMGKGRIYDNGCDYHLGALAKGTYKFRFWDRKPLVVTLTGKPADNARDIEHVYNAYVWSQHIMYDAIIGAEYSRH